MPNACEGLWDNVYGYAGKVVRVNLTSGKVYVNALDEKLALQYIGGKGFGAKILYDELNPKINPLDPSNLLIFAVGPASGLTLSGAATLRHLQISPNGNLG